MRGYDVILTARRQDRLEALARELTERHGVSAHVVVEDLADPHATERLVGVLAARGLASTSWSTTPVSASLAAMRAPPGSSSAIFCR